MCRYFQWKRFIKVWFKYHTLHTKRTKGKHLVSLITRRCSHCRCRGKLSLQHQNCAYVNELSNYYHLCGDCHQEVHDNYQELWNDYYYLGR